MKLSDVVVLDKRFARSINIERDNLEEAALQTYYVTSKAQEVVERFVAALEGEKVSAWSLVGPYGMGKSAFLNFLLCLSGPDTSDLTGIALYKLKEVDKNLYERFVSKKARVTGGRGFFRVPVMASLESVKMTLARGLREVIVRSDLPDREAVCNEIDQGINSGEVDSTIILGVVERVSEVSGTPLVIVIDELGKNLEYLSYDYHNGDLFILQRLAEMENVYLWVSLHQAFQEYMSGFSLVRQQEWNKIQGRFEEISFVESPTQMLHFMSRIIGLKYTKDLSGRVQEWANQLNENLESIVLAERDHFQAAAISKLYPLHPLTCLALVELCRRYAQNERTLVSFLCSGHVFALPAKMESIQISDDGRLPAIGLDSLYDYFFGVSTSTSFARPETLQWVHIHDLIQSAPNHTYEEDILLKNIGVLNLLPGSHGLRATLQILASVMEFSHFWTPDKTFEVLSGLVQRGIIFYREYADEYRLWEGSGFDVNAAIAEEKSRSSLLSLEEILEKYAPLSPMIAARHSLEKGTMRKFERRWLDSESLSNKALAPSPGFDGLLLYCYGTGRRLAPNAVPKKCTDDRPLMVAYAPIKETLLEIALDLVACRNVLDNYSQISHDKAAQKEVRFRYEVAMERFRNYVSKAFSPGKVDLIWYSESGERRLNNRKELSAELSRLCQDFYHDAPEINNEIVSGERLSGIAARARRELVEAMATRAEEEKLGFVGWGPEVAIYQSLLLDKKLHRKDPGTGLWYLTLETNDEQLQKLWKRLDQMLGEAGTNGKTVESMIDELRKPPVGLRQGPSLIYLSLYLLVKPEDLIVFCENAYHPYLSAADMALLLKRPDLFTVKAFNIDDVQRRIFSAYRSAIGKSTVLSDSRLRNAAMLQVVGPLMKSIDQLPRYSRQTRAVSNRAQRVRTAISNAVDPLRLILENLPQALDIGTSGRNIDAWASELEGRLRSTLNELGSAFDRLNETIRGMLVERFSSPDLEHLYSTLNKRAKRLTASCHDSDLRPVLQAMARTSSDLENWVQGIAGSVLKKPVDAWQDDDLEVFKVRLIDYTERIEQLALLAGIDSVTDDVHVIGVMGPNGCAGRTVVRVESMTSKVEQVLEQISRLSIDEKYAVLGILAKRLVLGGDDDG